MKLGRILVVDDDEAVRTMFGEYLTCCGYEVVLAEDGADALEKFIPGRFDCIISDMCMPRIDGFELLKRLKMQDSSVDVLIITGYPDIGSAINIIKEGAYDYVTKPLYMEDIRIKVERIINARKAKQSFKRMTGFFWALIASIPLWLILGIILGKIWYK